jgi:hypothetical protein
MTGRDLIIYILKNNLENEPVFKEGKFIGYMTAQEVAGKANVGVATVCAWIQQGWLDCVIIGGNIYIPANFKLPVRS